MCAERSTLPQKASPRMLRRSGIVPIQLFHRRLRPSVRLAIAYLRVRLVDLRDPQGCMQEMLKDRLQQLRVGAFLRRRSRLPRELESPVLDVVVALDAAGAASFGKARELSRRYGRHVVANRHEDLSH